MYNILWTFTSIHVLAGKLRGRESMTTNLLVRLVLIGVLALVAPSSQGSMVVEKKTSTRTTVKAPRKRLAIPHPSSSPITRHQSRQHYAATTKRKKIYVPKRPLAPPFPNGPCGGKIVTLDPSLTFDTDVRLSGNKLLLPPRPIQLWLPPGYNEHSDCRHPTLYCHDGQSVVSDAESWTGRSWRLTGALTRLANHGLLRTPMPIVVLLPSMEGDLIPGLRKRHLEYGDVHLPFAQAHADFVALTVKPLVDARFATLASRETYAMGASLGGQAALHLNLRHGDKFNGAACLSPCFGPGTLAALADPQSLLGATHDDSPTDVNKKKKRIYLDIGGDVGNHTVPFFDWLDHATEKHAWNPGYFWLDTSLQPAVQSMCGLLQRQAPHVEYEYHEIPGGRHNERAWSLRIDKPLRYLFGKQ